MGGERAKAGKKNRKLGRNKTCCERYRKEDRETFNRMRRLRRHLRRQPNYEVAMLAFREAGGTADYLNSLQGEHP